jgi:hypothetical protein
MAQTNAQTNENSNIVKLLAGSEVGKAALAQQAAANTLARRGLIAQVKALEREYEKRVPKLESAWVGAMEAVKAAENALLAAQKTANAELGAKTTASYTYSATRDRLEQQLRQSQHPALDGWAREMRAELDATRKRFSYFEQREITNPVTRLARRVVKNNAQSVAARVAAVMAALESAEKLALELDDQSTVPEKLGALAAALPVVEDPKINA